MRENAEQIQHAGIFINSKMPDGVQRRKVYEIVAGNMCVSNAGLNTGLRKGINPVLYCITQA